MVNIAVGTSTKSDSQRDDDDKKEQEDLDEGCDIFEPCEELVGQDEDRNTQDKEDGRL